MEEKTIKNRLAKLKTINKVRRKNKRFEYAACRSVISHHRAASILWGPNLFHNISNPNILDDALIRSTIFILQFYFVVYVIVNTLHLKMMKVAAVRRARHKLHYTKVRKLIEHSSVFIHYNAPRY